MLREIYFSAGGVGTFFIAIGMFVTFIGWWMAITETVTRESIGRGLRVTIILLVALVPPLGILVSAIYIRKDARKVSRAMNAAEKPQDTRVKGLSLSLAQSSAKAA